MPEKCAEPCSGLTRLEQEIIDLRQQNGDDHKEFRERLGKIEIADAVQDEKYTSIIEKLDGLTRCHDRLLGKLETLEAKPGRRWESMAEKAVWAVAAAVIAWMLRGVGL